MTSGEWRNSPQPATLDAVETAIRMDDGTGLWTIITGHQHPPRLPVVLLHGGPGLWDYLEPAAMLDDLTLVHRFDQRGCGRSGPSEDQRPDRFVTAIDELRAHWGYERWLVAGHPFGATLALAGEVR